MANSRRDEEPDSYSTTASGLAHAVLDAEADREEATRAENVLFADELLPGVGSEEMELRDGLAVGGTATFLVLLLLNSLDELEAAALAVLAPDIRDAFGVSDGTIVFVSAAAGSFIILGALPMGWMADRYRRGRIVGWASAVFAGMVFLSGLAVNAFSLFLARLGVGVSKSNTIPVHGSLIADTYPIGIRGRLGSITTGAGQLVAVMSPAIVGGLAALGSDADGWRIPFLLLGVPVLVLAGLAFRLPEPPRGQHEMLDVLGEVVGEGSSPGGTTIEAGFARLKRIRTLRTAVLGFAALGFGLFTGPVLSNLWLEDRFDLDSLDRGLLGTAGGIAVAAVVPFVGRHYDRLFRTDPARALRLVGLLILPASVLVPLQYLMPSAPLFMVAGIVPLVCSMSAFTMVGPLLQAVIPYRLRGLGSAFASIYIFFIGATGGAMLSALLTDSIGIRSTVIVLIAPSTIIGGLLVVRSASFIRNDLSLVVAELQEEMGEHNRRKSSDESVPAVQVSDIDFSYGQVQVLFDVGFEVRSGEVLALLGTNGAGKSTILKIIAGLATPSRGVVRLHGETITYSAPERRAREGVQLLIGGSGVFPAMTVEKNLLTAAFVYRHDQEDRQRRLDYVLGLFPELRSCQTQVAGSMSGGQQQMLALAMTLLHEPDVLLIDELSLGLAPIVVEDLLAVVESLRATGTTMVIVEQSLNVALSLADRAVFLEKGQVRFVGPAQDLAERDDLARAVFLGAEGG